MLHTHTAWRLSLAVPAFLMGALLAACADPVEILAEPAVAEGIVERHLVMEEKSLLYLTEVQYPGTSEECTPGQHCYCAPDEYCPQRASVHVEAETRVFARTPDGYVGISASRIVEGDRVLVWADVMLRSDPPQFPATQVVVIRDD